MFSSNTYHLIVIVQVETNKLRQVQNITFSIILPYLFI